MSIYTDGNAAVRIEEEQKKRRLTEQEELERRRRRAARARAQKKLEKQYARIRAAVAVMAVALVVGLALLAINGTVKSNELTREIEDLESDYQELVDQNNSKEFDINSSVDLDTVIKVATEELGMVRSSASQIVTYDAEDSEYIQQVAELPEN